MIQGRWSRVDIFECSLALVLLVCCCVMPGCEKDSPDDALPASGVLSAGGASDAGLRGGVAGGSERGAERPWFEECAVERGLLFRHQSGHKDRHWFPEIMGGGGALFDMDGDGDLDAYLVQSGGFEVSESERAGNQLFRNRGDGTFEDVTGVSGAGDRGYGMGVACGDYDNDGDVDLYVTNVGKNVLLRNDGGGRFSDVTVAAGVGDAGWGASASFLDYDADGDLDVFVVNYLHWSMANEIDCYRHGGVPDYCSPKSYKAPAPDVLYRNDGDGTFTDVSVAAGFTTAFGNGLGVVCADFNGDGRQDIYVANDGTLNQLWINQGAGRFEDEGLLLGCALDEDGKAKAGMGTHAADYDDDGDMDILVVNLAGETDSFYINDGDFFRDSSARVGLGTVSREFTRFGVGLVDFDNDGVEDLYQANGRVERPTVQRWDDPFAEPNLLFRGDGRGGFSEVTPRGGTKKPLVGTSRAAAFGDVDGDGGVDVLVVNRDEQAYLLRNVVHDRGGWVRFKVLDTGGVDGAGGRDALGARVTVRVDDREAMRVVMSGYSYLAGNDAGVHFGIGSADRVRDVTVRWVDGSVEVFGDYAAGKTGILKRGAGRH